MLFLNVYDCCFITSLLVFSRLEWILDCVKFIPLKDLISIITSTIYYVKYIVLHLKRNKYKKKILLENEINKVKYSVKKHHVITK